MPSVLLAASRPLEAELLGTALLRDGVERYLARGVQEALVMALAARPELVLIDRDLRDAAELVRRLRDDRATRGLSIAIASRGELHSFEVELLELGANALLRLPADAGWDRRLRSLMGVPLRREARLPVRLRLSDPLRPQADVIGLALDLSPNGMLVEVRAPLRLHDRFAFGFTLGAPGERVCGAARVVREAGLARFGLAFERLDRGSGVRIDRFLAAPAA